MGKRRNNREVKPLDPKAKLWETGNRDLWQSALISRDGVKVGHIIRQVIETEMYTIRYLVAYCPDGDRHILLPSDTVTEILPGAVVCELTHDELAELPDFDHYVNRTYETEVYATIERVPYWVEEESVLGPETDF